MSKEKQAQQNSTNQQIKRPFPMSEITPVAEMMPASVGLQNPAQLSGLPNLPTSRGMRQATVLRMQQQQGNTAVQRLLKSRMKPGNNGTSVASKPPIQTKLTVNEPDDSFEQEADRVAEAVMQSDTPPSLPPDDSDQNNGTGSPPSVQASQITTPDVTPETEQKINNLNGGTPLPDAERTFFEQRIGADFSQVRVHTSDDAVQTAKDLGARAYTRGSNIAFNEGEYQPGMRNGRTLLAHELTHVVQQGATENFVQRYALTGYQPAITATPHNIQLLPDFITSELNDFARHIPGYTLFTVIIGFNPLTGSTVPRTPINLLEGLMGLVPFGTMIFDALREYGIIRSVFEWVEGELDRLNLSMERIEQTIEAAWDDMELIEGFAYNLRILERHFVSLYNDVVSFATSLVDHIIEMIKEVAIGLAEELLADNKAWDLIKKVLHHDPLRDEPVEATTVEILEDFLMLIGKETELEQMRERGTLQETADWLDTRLGEFMSLLGELGGLFRSAWNAIQPQNLPNLASNLQSLSQQVVGFLGRVWTFASTVALEVLQFIKNALLGWLSEFAHEVPGFHLITVIIGKNPFTQEAVPRTAENIIKGFITLLPGGQEKYDQMAETGTIENAAQRIEGAMEELGISWEMVTGLFEGIWNGLSINDLIDPIGAFQRIVDQFGEPIGRLFEFIQVVVKEIFTLILELMNFPLDIIERIINNAMQAYEDIKNDPAAFFNNMLEAVKLGFTHFFDNILQHLMDGVSGWLLGQLEDAGVNVPSEFTLESVLDMVLEILGISMDQIWEKLGERIGPENVERIRGAIDRLTGIWTFISDVQERGIVAIWEYIESQISNLWDILLEKAQDWIVTEIIERVVTKLLSMLDPTGIMAVVNSFMAFFNAIQSAIEYFREILLIVDDYVSTIASVAQGDVEPGAEKMEGGLASSIPVAIGFLANQVGLGNLSEQLVVIIEGIRELVDRALDWLMDRAVSMGQSILNSLGLGTEEEVEENEETPESTQVKADALNEAGSRLRQLEKAEQIPFILQEIENQYRPRGLHSLTLEQNGTSGIEVVARASEPERRTITWDEVLDDSGTGDYEEAKRAFASSKEPGREGERNAPTVVAMVTVNGQAMGPPLWNEPGGSHAEDRAIEEQWPAAVSRAREAIIEQRHTRIVFAISATPCGRCSANLQRIMRELRNELGDEGRQYVELILAPRSLYEGSHMPHEGEEPASTATSGRNLRELSDLGWDIRQFAARDDLHSSRRYWDQPLAEYAHYLWQRTRAGS